MYFWHCMITLYDDLHCTCVYWTLDIVFFYYYFYSASVCTSSAIAIVFIKGYLT